MSDNIIVKLIEQKMKEAGWDALTPDSYCAYLYSLTDEDIIEAVENREQ